MTRLLIIGLILPGLHAQEIPLQLKVNVATYFNWNRPFFEVHDGALAAALTGGKQDGIRTILEKVYMQSEKFRRLLAAQRRLRYEIIYATLEKDVGADFAAQSDLLYDIRMNSYYSPLPDGMRMIMLAHEFGHGFIRSVLGPQDVIGAEEKLVDIVAMDIAREAGFTARSLGCADPPPAGLTPEQQAVFQDICRRMAWAEKRQWSAYNEWAANYAKIGRRDGSMTIDFPAEIVFGGNSEPKNACEWARRHIHEAVDKAMKDQDPIKEFGKAVANRNDCLDKAPFAP